MGRIVKRDLVEGKKGRTTAYAIATFVRFTREDHHIALVKPKTRTQPMRPSHAIYG